MTAVLYVAFWINAIVSLIHWQRLARRHVAAVARGAGFASAIISIWIRARPDHRTHMDAGQGRS